MPSFLQLPGGLPWWVTFAVLVPLGLYGLLFLAMPFGVFGVKSRLDVIEARLDEIHEEIRNLALQGNAGTARSDDAARDDSRPPILHSPPSAAAPTPRRGSEMRQTRSEPRLDWPR